MKNKYIYINALLLTVLICISIEIRHQTDLQQISALTVRNAALEQRVLNQADKIRWEKMYSKALQSEIERLTKEIAQIRQTMENEAQKTNRGTDRPRYNLTDTERDLIERVVMAESGGESYEGQMLVAQCILNACEIDGIRPTETVKKYVYAKGRPKPTESVIRAVSAVFDRGEQVTGEPIVYFYAPTMVKSKFHERQRFICEVGNHRFFAAG